MQVGMPIQKHQVQGRVRKRIQNPFNQMYTAEPCALLALKMYMFLIFLTQLNFLSIPELQCSYLKFICQSRYKIANNYRRFCDIQNSRTTCASCRTLQILVNLIQDLKVQLLQLAMYPGRVGGEKRFSPPTHPGYKVTTTVYFTMRIGTLCFLVSGAILQIIQKIAQQTFSVG